MICFGYNYIEQMLKMHNRKIEAIHLAENGQKERVQDFVSNLTSFFMPDSMASAVAKAKPSGSLQN